MNPGPLATYSYKGSRFYYRLYTELVIFPFHPHCLISNYLFINLYNLFFSLWEENTLGIILFGVWRGLTSIYITVYLKEKFPAQFLTKHSIPFLISYFNDGENGIGQRTHSLIEKWKYSKLTQYLSKILLFTTFYKIHPFVLFYLLKQEWL